MRCVIYRVFDKAHGLHFTLANPIVLPIRGHTDDRSGLKLLSLYFFVVGRIPPQERTQRQAPPSMYFGRKLLEPKLLEL